MPVRNDGDTVAFEIMWLIAGILLCREENIDPDVLVDIAVGRRTTREFFVGSIVVCWSVTAECDLGEYGCAWYGAPTIQVVFST